MKISTDAIKVEVKVDGYSLSSKEFKSIKIKETLHNNLPECELELEITKKVLPYLIIIGSKIEFMYKYGDDKVKYDFLLVSFDVTENNTFYSMKIKGVVYAPDYFQTSFKQEFFKDKTSLDILKTISNVTPKVNLKGNTDDKQTWIRPNYTEKTFVDYLYNYSYIKDDLLLIALNFKNELIIDSIKNIKSKKPKIISNYDKKSITRFKDYSFQKRVSVFDYKLSPQRKVRNFDVIMHKINEYTLPSVSLFNGKTYTELKEYYPFKSLLNNMNTFDEYLYAFRYNQVFRERLNFFQIHLSLDVKYYKKLELFDYITFKDFDDRSKEPIAVTSGEYIISEISQTFNIKGLVENNIVLSRDYFL